MRVIVLIKPIKSKLLKRNDSIDEYTANPYDLFALNEVIDMKCEELEVVCVSMGTEMAKEVLVRCLATGCDRTILLSDKYFAGADTIATAYTLAAAINEIGYDFVVTGEKSIDGETGQTKYGISELLGIPCYSHITKIHALSNDKISLIRKNNKINELISVHTPCLIAFDEYALNFRNLSLIKMKMAKKKEIKVWTANELDLDVSQYGIKGAKTRVIATHNIINKKNIEIIEGCSRDISEKIAKIIKRV